MTNKISQLEARLEEMDHKGERSKERVDLMMEIATRLISGDDPPRLIELTAEARRLSEELEYTKGQAQCLFYEGVRCCMTAEHTLGLETVDAARSKFESIEDEFGVATTVFLEGNLMRSIGSLDQALTRHHKSLEFFENNGHPRWAAHNCYDLGLLYHELGDPKKSLEYFEKSIQLNQWPDEVWLEGRALMGMGMVAKKMGDLDKALDYHDRSITIFRKIGYVMGEARVLDEIGTINCERGEHEISLGFHRLGLDLRRGIGMRRAEATSLLNMARAYLGSGDTANVVETAREALDIAEETQSKQHIYDAHRLLSEGYELDGDTARALLHHKEFQRSKEAVYNDQASERVQKLHIAFEVEKAEKVAEFERQKNVELSDKNERLQQLLKELGETQSQLVQAEKMAALGKLVAGLVHEMNTPLGASASAIDVTDRCIQRMEEWCMSGKPLDHAKDFQKMFERIRDNHGMTREANRRISTILTSLKSFASLDQSELQAIDIHEALENTLALIEHEWRDRIDVVKKYKDIPPVQCWPAEINQVFMNLLTNAIESIDGEGAITIATRAKKGNVRIDIADTGSGIAPDKLESLFDPDFSSKGARVKARMGLLVSLNVVQKHRGKIDVDSTVGKGTTVSVTLPAQPA